MFSGFVYRGISCNSLAQAKHENEYELKISPSWCPSQAILWCAVNSPCMSSNVWFIVLFWAIQIQTGFASSWSEGSWSIVFPNSNKNHTTYNVVLRKSWLAVPWKVILGPFPPAQLSQEFAVKWLLKIRFSLLFWFPYFQAWNVIRFHVFTNEAVAGTEVSELDSGPPD